MLLDYNNTFAGTGVLHKSQPIREVGRVNLFYLKSDLKYHLKYYIKSDLPRPRGNSADVALSNFGVLSIPEVEFLRSASPRTQI